MISYEISIGLILISLVLYAGSLNLLDLLLIQGYMGIGFILPFFPLFLLFFISSLAETNRPPFDLPEAWVPKSWQGRDPKGSRPFYALAS